jgi:hypothetical protein
MTAVDEMITVGEPIVLETASPVSRYGVVFEDDGRTGYFYGLDFTSQGNPILDALHIYNVSDVSDREDMHQVQIKWSRDGLKALLAVNGRSQAIFDFEAQRGYCRSGFPPTAQWSVEGHDWDDDAVKLFK